MARRKVQIEPDAAEKAELVLGAATTAIWEKDRKVWLSLNNYRVADTNQSRPSWLLVFVVLLFGFAPLLIALGIAAAHGTLAHLRRAVWFLMLNPYTLFCLGLCYCLVFSVSTMCVDPTTRRWTIRRGLMPRVKTFQGSLDNPAMRFEMTCDVRGNDPEQLWMLSLVGAAIGESGPLPLRSFNLKADVVPHEVARQTYGEIARRIGLPLVDKSDGKRKGAAPAANSGRPVVTISR